MLKIESIKLPPGAGMAELTAAAARLLRVREKDLTELRVLRRSVDAREDVAPGVYRGRRREGRGRRAAPLPQQKDHPAGTLPSLLAPRSPAGTGGAAGGGGRGPGGPLRRAGAGPGGAAAHPAGAREERGGRARQMWSGSGPPACWTPPATSSSARAAPGPSPTES